MIALSEGGATTFLNFLLALSGETVSKVDSFILKQASLKTAKSEVRSQKSGVAGGKYLPMADFLKSSRALPVACS
jgi:hypothetical protein